MGGYDHTVSKRMKALRQRRKALGMTEVREFVPPDLVPALKAIAEEMRDPAKAEAYRNRFPKSEKQEEE